MTIKDLFSKKAAISNSAISSSTLVESPDFVSKKIEVNNRFEPHIDFATASNFVKFGSAEQHYATAIERIYGEYPYDGSGEREIRNLGYLLRLLIFTYSTRDTQLQQAMHYSPLTGGGLLQQLPKNTESLLIESISPFRALLILLLKACSALLYTRHLMIQ